MVKDIALNNGELKGFVNEKIIEDIKNKVKAIGNQRNWIGNSSRINSRNRRYIKI